MRYCAYFCEENVWHLCQSDAAAVPRAARQAVFISNAAKQVPMRHQKAGHGGVVYWDYHVVMTTPGRVWDLDTTLPFGVDLDDYVAQTFMSSAPAGLAPRFRVVDAAVFVRTFASDRSHMADDGRERPAWPPIGGGAMNLMRFVDMDAAFVGSVVDVDAFRRAR